MLAALFFPQVPTPTEIPAPIYKELHPYFTPFLRGPLRLRMP